MPLRCGYNRGGAQENAQREGAAFGAENRCNRGLRDTKWPGHPLKVWEGANVHGGVSNPGSFQAEAVKQGTGSQRRGILELRRPPSMAAGQTKGGGLRPRAAPSMPFSIPSTAMSGGGVLLAEAFKGPISRASSCEACRKAKVRDLALPLFLYVLTLDLSKAPFVQGLQTSQRLSSISACLLSSAPSEPA